MQCCREDIPTQHLPLLHIKFSLASCQSFLEVSHDHMSHDDTQILTSKMEDTVIFNKTMEKVNTGKEMTVSEVSSKIL